MSLTCFGKFSLSFNLIGILFLGLFTPSAFAATTDNASGENIYKANCAVCHGEQGDGMSRARHGLNPPPRDFTSPLAKAELNPERMVTAITHGRPGTAMMPFANKLSKTEINSVVDYIRDTFMRGPAVQADAQMISLDQGKRVFTSNCAVCHGDNGSGAMWTQASLNPAPRNFTTKIARDELSRERMLSSVTHGRPGTAMMAFSSRLSVSDIEAVVDYIRAEFMAEKTAQGNQLAQNAPNPHAAAASPHARATPQLSDADMSLAFPAGLKGDATLGRAFYLKNCFSCHGEQGDGNGPRSSSISPRPRNFLDPESRRTLNRPALLKAVSIGKPGTPMPAWNKVLTDQEIANVAEFVFQEFIHSSQKKKVSN